MDLKKKIILSGNIINARKYVLQQAFNGNSFYNYEESTPSMLVENLLDSKYRVISDKEAAYILLNIISEKDFGLKKIVFTVGAASKLLEVINDYRLSNNNTFEYLEKGQYKELLNCYKDYLIKNNQIDYIFGLELIKDKKQTSRLLILNDFELSPLEKNIFKSIFNDIERISPINNANIKDNKINPDGTFPCYGIYNEILNVINIIKEKNYSPNDCEIVYTNNVYENLIKGTLDAFKIDYAFSSLHAKSTNLISFMLDILDYVKRDYRYELLEEILKNKGLDAVYLKEFYKTLSFQAYIIGYGRERTAEALKINDYSDKPNVKEFLSDLLSFYDGVNFDYDKFVEFSLKYNGNGKEKQLLSTKLDNLKHIIDISKDKIQTTIDELSSLKYSESDTNSLQVSLLGKTFSLKKNLFVIGLSQNYVSCGNVENPFILDVDKYKEQLKENKNIHILDNMIKANEEALDYLIHHRISDDSTLYLSYSYFNKIDFRPSAPSIYYIDKGGEVYDEKINNRINYYDIATKSIDFSKSKFKDASDEELIEDYDNGLIKASYEDKKHIDLDEEKPIIVDKNEKHDYYLSPSALKTLIDCPFRYYYSKIDHLPDPSYPRLNDDDWLDANARGTFFHRVMELYANDGLMKENFKDEFDNNLFDVVFDKALKETENLNPIKNQYIYEVEKNEIKTISLEAIKAIIEDFKVSNYRVLGCEYELKETKYEYNGIKFSGEIDRVDGYLENDTLHVRIIDYKSGGHKAKEDRKYIQHAIYPLCIRDGKKNLFGLKYDNVVIDEFIYDYVFAEAKETYSTEEIDDEIKLILEQINSLLVGYIKENKCFDNFNNYFIETSTELEEAGEFTRTKCQYCKYKNICIKRLEVGKEWKE